MILGTDVRAGVPETPPHSYTRPSEKHDPFIYFPYRKLTPFMYYFWKLTPFIHYFSNFTHSYTFWVKKIPHWYTFDVKMIPIHILGGLKSIPHSSRTSVICIYLYNGSYPPPPPPPWFCVFWTESLNGYSKLKGTYKSQFSPKKFGSLRSQQLTKLSIFPVPLAHI